MKSIKQSIWLLILLVFTSAVYADIINSLESASDNEIELIIEELIVESDASNEAILTLLNSKNLILLGREELPACNVGIMILYKREQINTTFYSTLFELAIEELKGDKNMEGWFSASMLLTQKTSNDIVPFLIEKLDSEDPAFKRLSIYILSEKKDKRAVEPSKKLFMGDWDSLTMKDVSWLLKGLEETFKSEMTHIPSEDSNSRKIREDKILSDTLFPILSEGIKSQNQKVRFLSCAYLGNLGLEVSFPELVSVLENDPNQNIRAYAAYGMRFIDKKETVDVLIKALSDSSPLVQVKAATTLADYKKSDAGADILVKNLNNSNDEIREDAARGLIYVTTPGAEEALCQALSNEKIADIRYLIPLALEKHGTSTCLPVLFSALEDQDDRVRSDAAAAIKAIIDRDTNKSIPILKKIIQDGSDISQEKAKEYLQKIKSSKD